MTEYASVKLEKTLHLELIRRKNVLGLKTLSDVVRELLKFPIAQQPAVPSKSNEKQQKNSNKRSKLDESQKTQSHPESMPSILFVQDLISNDEDLEYMTGLKPEPFQYVLKNTLLLVTNLSQIPRFSHFDPSFLILYEDKVLLC
jgi:hypothetical protein